MQRGASSRESGLGGNTSEVTQHQRKETKNRLAVHPPSQLNQRITTMERAYTSDLDAYECYVGQITPQEFVKGFEEFEDSIDEAIKSFIRQFPYEEPVPSWLEDALYRYVESKLEEDDYYEE